MLQNIIQIAKKAGVAILDIYENEDFSKTIDFKADDSPLTIADKKAHEVIAEELERLYPEIPVLSEEGAMIDYAVRKNWTKFWCVDPLDGTKEFIKKNGQFTVNIALIENGVPTLGVIYAPVLDTTYAGDASGAIKEMNGETVKIEINRKTEKRIAVGSASHAAPEEDEVLAKYDVVDKTSRGSSLKFCLVAEGNADVYPRYAPTMEWDTAAGQAICNAVGIQVISKETNQQLLYNKENLLNPWFLVSK